MVLLLFPSVLSSCNLNKVGVTAGTREESSWGLAQVSEDVGLQQAVCGHVQSSFLDWAVCILPLIGSFLRSLKDFFFLSFLGGVFPQYFSSCFVEERMEHSERLKLEALHSVRRPGPSSSIKPKSCSVC